MASGAASTCGASQPATDASPTGGTSQAPSGAPLVEHAQERRQALDGECYTKEEFRQFYQKPYGSFSAWRRYWDRAVREAVAPGEASWCYLITILRTRERLALFHMVRAQRAMSLERRGLPSGSTPGDSPRCPRCNRETFTRILCDTCFGYTGITSLGQLTR